MKYPYVTKFKNLKENDVFIINDKICNIKSKTYIKCDCVGVSKDSCIAHAGEEHKMIYLRNKKKLFFHYEKNDICELYGREWYKVPVVIIRNINRRKIINKLLIKYN